ncbi:MAG: anti-sigma factor [Kofleriaceae bacterium]
MSTLDPRAEELLAERAQRALDDKEHWELQQLGAEHDESFDLAAAAVMVATTVIEPMPSSLADKILAQAPGAGGGLDWRRTLPGVAMPPPAEARDTIVGVDLRDVQKEAAELAAKTEPFEVQKPLPPGLSKPPGAAILDTLPPPSSQRPPAFPAPPHVDTNATTLPPEPNTPTPQPRDVDVRFAQVHTPPPQPAHSKPIEVNPPLIGQPPQPMPPVIGRTPTPHGQGRTPLPQDSQPYSIEQPPMSVEVPPSRERPRISDDDLARARARRDADTVPLKPVPDVAPKRSIAPWLMAAVCLLAAGGAFYYAWDQKQKPAVTPPIATAKTPAEERNALLASASDAQTIAWTVTQDAAAKGASGDVVWSAAQQKGFMRFVGLAVNDPKQFQYQLWIFDKTRDQAFPVDGGVFDVGANGEVIVAINPKLHVDDLALFAVTVEKPGGVVVSKRERIVVTAART